RVVDAVAGDKHILDPEADEIDRRLDLPPLRLVEQRAGPKAPDLAPTQQICGESDRPAGIDDVVDEQRLSPFDVAGYVAEQAHLAAAHHRGPVAAEPKELDFGAGAGAVQSASEVGDEDGRAL